MDTATTLRSVCGKSENDELQVHLKHPITIIKTLMTSHYLSNLRCRSAFKLLEIDQKSRILHPGQVIIDCGAAPGSWTQVAVNKSNSNGKLENKPKGLVIGIDLLPIYPIDGAETISNMNFTTEKGQNKIRELLKERSVDCVLSDMAPNATGVRSLDQENITTLCYSVLRFALQMSSQGAHLLMKIWDNGEVPTLERDILKYYKTVKTVKPHASRMDSAEMFILAKYFKGLEK